MNVNKFFDNDIIDLIKNMSWKHKIYYCSLDDKKRLIAICDKNKKIITNKREFERVTEILNDKKNLSGSWLELHFNDFDQNNEINFEIRIISDKNIKKILKECSRENYSDNESCYDKIFKHFIILPKLSMDLLLKNRKEIIRLLQIDKNNNTYTMYENFDGNNILKVIKNNSDDESKIIRSFLSKDDDNNYLILEINNNCSHFVEIYNIYRIFK